MIWLRFTCSFRKRYFVSQHNFHMFDVYSRRCSKLPISSLYVRNIFTDSMKSKCQIRVECVNSVRAAHCSAIIDKSFHHEKKLRRKDGLTTDYVLIYRVKSEASYRMFYAFGYFMLTLGPLLALRTLLRSYDYDDSYFSSIEIMESAGQSILLLTDLEFQYLIAILIGLSGFLYTFMRRFPVRIYYNGKTYVAIFMSSFFPFLRTKYSFTTGRKYELPALFGKTLYVLGHRKARLFPEFFRRPVDQFKMTNETSVEYDE